MHKIFMFYYEYSNILSGQIWILCVYPASINTITKFQATSSNRVRRLGVLEDHLDPWNVLELSTQCRNNRLIMRG